MPRKRNISRGYIAAFAIFNICNCSCRAQNRAGLVTSHGDPAQVVRQAIQPLFQHKKGADSNETNFFSPELKRFADAYFAADDNARDFDADWLLGMQDWDGTPSFSPFILGERRARVTVEFTMDDKSKGATNPISRVIYTVTFDERSGWKIDDIAYGDGIKLRDMIAHDSWCRATFRHSC